MPPGNPTQDPPDRKPRPVPPPDPLLEADFLTLSDEEKKKRSDLERQRDAQLQRSLPSSFELPADDWLVQLGGKLRTQQDRLTHQQLSALPFEPYTYELREGELPLKVQINDLDIPIPPGEYLQLPAEVVRIARDARAHQTAARRGVSVTHQR
jgi:hypothetical protein